MKKIIPTLITALVLFSCGKDNNSSKEQGGSQNSQDETDTTNSPQIRSIYQVMEDVKAGDMSEEDGLNEITKLLKAMGNIPEDTIKDLAEFLSDVEGPLEQNLAIFLGISTTRNTSIESLSDLFIMLADESFLRSVEEDRILMETMALKMTQHNSSENEFFNTDNISYYFNLRIEYLLYLDSNETEIFNNYALLYDLIPRTDLEILNKLLPKVKITNSTPITTRIKFANTLINSIKTGDFKTINSETLPLIQSAKNNSEWAVNALKTNPENLETILNITNAYLMLFDNLNLESFTYKQNQIDAFNARTTEIMLPFLATLQDQIKRNKINTKELKSRELHPYLKIYINKAILQEQREIWHFSEQLSDSFNEFKDKFAIELKEFNQTDFSFFQSENSFIENYYNVELKKHFLEVKSTTDYEASSVSDTRISLYKSLINDLIQTLNYIYDKSLTVKDIKKKESKGNLYSELEADYKESETGIFEKNYCATPTSCKKVNLEPGIYTIPSIGTDKKYGLTLFGSEINFHPLSMIMAPGATVTLNFDKITNAWIDVSGIDGETKELSFKHMELELPTIQHTLISKKPVKNKKAKYKDMWTLKGDIPEIPDQLNSEDGTSAGKIVINQSIKGKFYNFQLFASFGGDGANGAEGISTKLNVPLKIKTTSEKFSTFPKDSCVEEITYNEVTIVNNYGFIEYGNGNCGPNGACDKRRKWKKIKSKKSIKKIIKSLKKSKGGDAGNAGNGTRVTINTPFESEYSHLITNQIVAPGLPGKGGKPGECGVGSDEDKKGKNGDEAKILSTMGES